MKILSILFLMCVVAASPGSAMGRKAPEGLSVLLVPARPSLVQVGMDMESLGKAVLMSYAPSAPAEDPFLHIWDGARWLPVPPERFALGSFLTQSVDRLVVIGPENDRTAFLIETALGWCPEVLHLATDQVTELINQLGKVYGFSPADWEWIAQRYELQLEDLTRDLPRESWYDTHRPEDVPMTERPWRRRKQVDAPPPPDTSLSPVDPGDEMDPEKEPASTPAPSEAEE